MNHRSQPHHKRQSVHGQVMILFAVSSIVLLGMMALAIDVGFLLAERRQVQAAADSAALAAAHSVLQNEVASMEASGKSYGATNADVAPGDVDVNRPPTSGDHAGDDDYVEVVIEKDVDRFFLGAVYDGDWTVSASAVAVVEPKKVNVAMLALNSDAGGIDVSGNPDIIVTGGSIVSNYNIVAGGNSSISADEQVNANDGISLSGNASIDGGQGSNQNAPEVPDPLAGVIEPPDLPTVPVNPVSTVNPAGKSCYSATPSSPAGTSGSFSGNNSCVSISGSSSSPYVFNSGSYRFNGAGLKVKDTRARISGGTWNFNGGAGIDISGNTPLFEMQSGNYSFLSGAGIDISGNTDSIIVGGNYYFSGGGGIDSSGNGRLTLNTGTYIFDGGPGLTSSGNQGLHFNAGTYDFWFARGADFDVSGNIGITFDPGAYVTMHFYGDGNNFADMDLSGNVSFDLPSGEYYFDRGNMSNSGNTGIGGEEIFIYFEDEGSIESNGNASFGFTAHDQDDEVYPGHYPGVVIYSHPDNDTTFSWSGNTSSTSQGIIYLPGSKVEMSGNTNGEVLQGQFIADSFEIDGNAELGIQFHEYVETGIPTVFLAE